MTSNHYLLLGIPQDADLPRIKAAYRSLAKRFHPDANQGSEAAADLFRQINEAYRTLANPQKRERYDRILQASQLKDRILAQKRSQGSPGIEPEEKFQKFLHSLLNALFGPPEPAGQPVTTANRPSPRPRPVTKKPQTPAFSFYFHLAMEKEASSYQRGEDGVIRPPEKTAKSKRSYRNFHRPSRGRTL